MPKTRKTSAVRRHAKPAKRGRPANSTTNGGGFDVASLRKQLGLSRAAFAKLISASAGSIYNWERKTSEPHATFVARLKDLKKQAAEGNVPVSGRARKSGGDDVAPVPAPPTPGKIDVRALRQRLGLSQAALAKLVGVSGGSVQNWEKGKPIRAKSLAKLQGLAASGPTGESTGARAPQSPSVSRTTPIQGEPTHVVLADELSIIHGGGRARFRFGVIAPGTSGARAILDVVLPSELVERLRS